VLKLPDAVSSAHLGLAYLFLALAVVIALATAPSCTTVAEPNPLNAGRIRTWAVTAATIVFAQSILGAVVRHTESGMACPDIPLCLGELIPPLSSGFVALHFFHRVLGLIVLGVVTALFFAVRNRTRSRRIRTFAAGAAAGVIVQVALGFISVYTTLGVVPVSLHTLVAALIMVFLTAIATLAWPRDATVAQRDGPGRARGAASRQPHPSTASMPDAATSEGLPLGS
jgi:cytochrome c oxidase assembly protein subunit 15